ncbi:MAG: VWA domain-containing protein [Planctomycetota bacterium]
MRIVLAGLLLLTPVHANEFGRVLRQAKHADRETRRAALDRLARGEVKPEGRGQTERMIRSLRTYLSGKSLAPDRARAVLALGRLQREKVHLMLLARLPKERDDRVLVSFEKVFAGSRADQWAEGLVRRYREEKDVLARAALLRIALALPGDEMKKLAVATARMAESWELQATAVQALHRQRGEKTQALCIELLDHSDPAVVGAAIEVLTAQTKKKFGRDEIAWKTWWNTREETEKLDEAIAKAGRLHETKTVAADERKEPVRSYFFGVPVRGKKIVYVFDVSGSMRSKLPLAFAQLVASIKGLPPASSFEVVFFNEQVHPWRRRFSTADPITKSMLVRELGEIEIKSYTNLFDAMELGLELGPDEMFVISDGEPNRGRKQSERDIRSELRKINPRRKVTIHTVSVVRTVDGGKHVELLRAIAGDHGGKSVQRTLY